MLFNIAFILQPTHLIVADLHESYATTSYNNDANLISAPEDRTFCIPDGFTVKLFLSRFRIMRSFLYTPMNSTLVSDPILH